MTNLLHTRYLIFRSAWSDEGCQIQKTNETHTVCECNHLTNFAVLMDVHAVRLDIAHQVALQIITYIGCIISVVCLVLAILTFQLFRGLKVMYITARLRRSIGAQSRRNGIFFPHSPLICSRIGRRSTRIFACVC